MHGCPIRVSLTLKWDVKIYSQKSDNNSFPISNNNRHYAVSDTEKSKGKGCFYARGYNISLSSLRIKINAFYEKNPKTVK